MRTCKCSAVMHNEQVDRDACHDVDYICSIIVIKWIGTWSRLLSGCNAVMHPGSGGCAVEMQLFNMLVLLMMLVIIVMIMIM